MNKTITGEKNAKKKMESQDNSKTDGPLRGKKSGKLR